MERLLTLFLLALCLNSATAREDLDYSTVTNERLLEPEDRNWLQYRRTYDSWGYSPLKEITAKNVSDLKVEWVFSTGVVEAHQSPPLVNDGIMYVTTPGNQIIALDLVETRIRNSDFPTLS